MLTDTSQLIPWHDSQWQQIRQMLSQDRMPHALLFEGMQGLGKQWFATQLAQLLLCQSNDSSGSDLAICQTCSSCEWFNNDSHPDFTILTPEEGKKLISVDAVRTTIKKVVQTSHQSGYRVLLINPADAMTVEAANSLLKTLEEPPPQTLLMLLTDKPTRLLPTIRSRATRVKFKVPAATVAGAWLQKLGLNQTDALQALALSHGAPFRFSADTDELETLLVDVRSWWSSWQALQAHKISPVQIAKEWKGAEPQLLLTWLEGLLSTMIKSQVFKVSANASLYPNIEEYAASISYEKLFVLRDRVLNMLQKLQTSLNWGLQLESLAIECQALSR